ncbi:M48 family metallopeptidase [Stieleria varia]|uniref:Heat shock protein HtpX n=1 Tax=Stieleria varia TaxID=2528005 RepID=A0A5C6ARL5_9BACT|nr:M48 family metallopeptidase [Stieleria varia]TWU02141.1 heat shock protein HtpX [Stieleria varia]
MFIRFKCGQCEKVFKVDAKNAGRKTKCTQCQTILVIPGVPASAQGRTQSSGQNPSAQQPERFVGESPPSQASQPQEDAWLNQDSGTPSTPKLEGSLFDNLPAFEQLSAPVAAPRSADPIFDQALSAAALDATAHLEVPGVSAPHRVPVHVQDAAAEMISVPASAAPMSGDIADVLGSLDQTVASAVAVQQMRNRAAVAPKLTVVQIQQSFAAEMPPVERTKEMGSKLVTVSMAMLIVPALFTLFVIASSVILFWLFFRWLGSEPFMLPHPALGMLFVAACFLVLASWLPVFNMFIAVIRLMLHGAGGDEQSMTLTRENQPVMYEFVDQICDKVGAPKPSRINLDCEFNASASLRRGWMSFGKPDLVLTLGVPLIAVQSTQQLAVDIAHEFGHFRQGREMKASYLIRSLTGWFMHSAYVGMVRAEINSYLIANSEHSNNFLLGIMYVIGWVGRRMMWYFGLAGHAVAGSLSREMEYDADRHAIHLAGTRAFIESSANFERYGAAYQITIENLKQLFHAGVLVDNIPRFMLHIGRTLPATTIQQIAAETEQRKQELHDTHPPTRERNAAAAQLNQNGIVTINRPASDLIHHWQQLCKDITLDFYSRVTDQEILAEHTTPLENVLRDEHKLLLQKQDS